MLLFQIRLYLRFYKEEERVVDLWAGRLGQFVSLREVRDLLCWIISRDNHLCVVFVLPQFWALISIKEEQSCPWWWLCLFILCIDDGTGGWCVCGGIWGVPGLKLKSLSSLTVRDSALPHGRWLDTSSTRWETISPRLLEFNWARMWYFLFLASFEGCLRKVEGRRLWFVADTHPEEYLK